MRFYEIIVTMIIILYEAMQAIEAPKQGYVSSKGPVCIEVRSFAELLWSVLHVNMIIVP